MSAVPELDNELTEDFGFRLVKTLQATTPFTESDIPSYKISLLAWDNISERFAVADKAQILIGSTTKLNDLFNSDEVESGDVKELEGNVIIPATGVTHIMFDASDSTLLVAMGKELHKISKNGTIMSKIAVLNDDVREMKFFGAGKVLVLDAGGALQLIDLTDGSASPVVSGVTSFDVRGPDIVITTEDNEVRQVKVTGEVVKQFEIDFEGKEDYKVNTIQWISKLECVVLFVNSDNDSIGFIIDTANSLVLQFTNILAPISEFERDQTFYISTLRNWSPQSPHLAFILSSLSADIVTVTPTKLIEAMNDTDRAQLPLDEDTFVDSIPVGAAVDITNTTDITREISASIEDNSIPPLPRLVVLTHDGKLLAWDVFDIAAIKSKELKPLSELREALVNESTTAANVTAPAAPIAAAPVLTAENPFANKSSSSPNPFALGSSGSSLFGASPSPFASFGNNNSNSNSNSNNNPSALGSTLQKSTPLNNLSDFTKSLGSTSLQQKQQPRSSRGNALSLSDDEDVDDTDSDVDDNSSMDSDGPGRRVAAPATTSAGPTSFGNSAGPTSFGNSAGPTSFGNSAGPTSFGNATGPTSFGNSAGPTSFGSGSVFGSGATSFGSTSFGASGFGASATPATKTGSPLGSVATKTPAGTFGNFGTQTTGNAFGNLASAQTGGKLFGSSFADSDSSKKSPFENLKSGKTATIFGEQSKPAAEPLETIEKEEEKELVHEDEKSKNENENYVVQEAQVDKVDDEEEAVEDEAIKGRIGDDSTESFTIIDSPKKQDDGLISPGSDGEELPSSLNASDVDQQSTETESEEEQDTQQEYDDEEGEEEILEARRLEDQSFADVETEDEEAQHPAAEKDVILPREETDIESSEDEPGDSEIIEEREKTPEEDKDALLASLIDTVKKLKGEDIDKISEEDKNLTLSLLLKAINLDDNLFSGNATAISKAVETTPIKQVASASAETDADVSVAIETDNLGATDVSVQAFEDEELYLSKYDQPLTLPPYVVLGNIEHPSYDGVGAVEKKLLELYYFIEANFQILGRNLDNIGEFIADHEVDDNDTDDDEKVRHTALSLPFATNWRLGESGTIAGFISEKQDQASSMLSELQELDLATESTVIGVDRNNEKAVAISKILNTFERLNDSLPLLKSKQLSFPNRSLRSDITKKLAEYETTYRSFEIKLLIFKLILKVIQSPSNDSAVWDLLISQLDNLIKFHYASYKELKAEIDTLTSEESTTNSDITAMVSTISQELIPLKVSDLQNSTICKLQIGAALRTRDLDVIPSASF